MQDEDVALITPEIGDQSPVNEEAEPEDADACHS